MTTPATNPSDIWNNIEFWKATAPVFAACIAFVGVIFSTMIARWQFKKSERRIEAHFLNGDATKARLTVRQSELYRLNDEVALASRAVEKLLKSAVKDGGKKEIVSATAAAFQDVAPIFKTMSTLSSNWSIQAKEINTLETFESALTSFFIRLDFAPPDDERRKYQDELTAYAKQVETTSKQARLVLRSSWESNSIN
jgi:peptide subunit release factor RF-3